jgi:plasmid stabilization system protein ParE
MTAFRLTEAAFRDLDSILAHLMDQVSVDAAYQLRSELFLTFARLTEFPGLGHARPGLTSRPVVFFAVEPYLVIFDRRSDPLTIHAILHGARDVKRMLRSRSF